jgi:hypothetical protein
VKSLQVSHHPFGSVRLVCSPPDSGCNLGRTGPPCSANCGLCTVAKQVGVYSIAAVVDDFTADDEDRLMPAELMPGVGLGCGAKFFPRAG